MAFLVGSLKIIISDVPDNVKLQVCVSVTKVLRCYSGVTDNMTNPDSSSSASDTAREAAGPGKSV